MSGGRRARLVSGLLLDDDERAAVDAHGAELILDGAAHDEETALGAAASADVWYGPGLTPAVLAAAAGLRWFQTVTIGVEPVLHPGLVDSPVEVCNVRLDYSATADHAVAVLLALARGVLTAVRQQSAHLWRMPEPDDLMTVRGSRLVVIGTGQIGRAVSVRARAFEMDVHGVNRTGRPDDAFTSTVPSSGLAAAVATADWIVNACPLTPQTAGIVSREVLQSAKRGAGFINVGRGKTVDEAALVDVLRSGQVRAAALDVFAEEPLAADSPLWDLPNVLVTPHSAGMIAGTSSRRSSFDCLLANLDRDRRGVPLRSVVDKRHGY